MDVLWVVDAWYHEAGSQPVEYSCTVPAGSSLSEAGLLRVHELLLGFDPRDFDLVFSLLSLLLS